MKLYTVFASLLFASMSSGAFDVVLRKPDGALFDPVGKVQVTLERKKDVCGSETIRCRLVSLEDGVRMLRISAEDAFKGATRVWDGKDEILPPEKRISHPLFMAYRFMMIASWNDSYGTAIAAGAEDFNSYADGIIDGNERAISVHASLMGKGSVYECRFHKIPFSPKYGIREAFAKYYCLYPRRFKRDPNVHPWFYGIGAHYRSWQSPNPDSCRFMNATWEWCYGADRSWGDLLNTLNPSGKRRDEFMWVDLKYFERNGRIRKFNSSKITREKFDEIQRSRFSNGYYCGVANGFYTMSLANISKKFAARHPDSRSTVHTLAHKDYYFAPDVFAFPECSWGVDLRQQLSKLMKKCDLGGMAFDVSSPRTVYRGEKLGMMENVSWDEFGPGVVRGVANAKLFDYLRTIPNKVLPGKAGSAVNTRYHHVSDMLYADTVMHETTPWDMDYPFPVHSRLALGEKALTLWEGFSPKTFDPNFARWPKNEQAMLYNDLSRLAVHRSLMACVSLPIGYMTEYVSRISHAFVRLNNAGWKPVVGAKAEGEKWDLARYGLGENSFIAVCNLTNAFRKVKIDVYPSEMETGLVSASTNAFGCLYVPFFGGEAESRYSFAHPERVELSVDVGGLLVNVLEMVAKVDGAGSLSASWEGDGFGRMTLKLVSRHFKGSVVCRSAVEGYHAVDGCRIAFNGGETVRVRYCDERLAKAADAIATLDLSDLRNVQIEHASDLESKEIAERFSFFFRALTPPDDVKSAKGHCSPVRMVECGDLKPLSVRIGGLVVSAADRVELSDFARRVLNVLNAMRYPEYGPKPKMDVWDAERFTFLRY